MCFSELSYKYREINLVVFTLRQDNLSELITSAQCLSPNYLINVCRSTTINQELEDIYKYIYIYIYISKGLQCALTAITIVALWQLPHLGHGMCVYIYTGVVYPGFTQIVLDIGMELTIQRRRRRGL